MYIAAVLTEHSAIILKSFILSLHVRHGEIVLYDFDNWQFKTAQGQPLPHHMTINMGEFDNNLNDPSILGREVLLTIDEIWSNEKLGVCAAPVIEAITDDGIKVFTMNSVPHVTCCIKPGSKPKFSNQMFENGEGVIKAPPQPLVLKAKIEVCV